MAKLTLFEMKEKKFSLENELATITEFVTEKYADPTYSIEDLKTKEAKADELRARIAGIEKAINDEETKQRARLAVQNGGGEGMTAEETKIKAKADFYRAAIDGKDKGLLAKAYEGLGAIPAADADLGNGDKLLPTNLSRTLITEPVEVNPLRTIARVTNVTGLEEPKLGFTIEDADIGDVTDKQTANEIEMEGDVVSYGRTKIKVKATVKDTVYHGTDVDLVNAIEGNLRAALARREKLFAFQSAEDIDTNSDTAHAHMSFYQVDSNEDTVIKTVEGDDLYNAIVNAYADLADDFAANAKIVMKKTDYFGIIKDLTNSSEALFGGKPAAILGVPVVFCDKAETPVVGDFSYYGINYDIGTVFDTAKDVDKGEYKFVLTAWGDQQIRLKSAFRLAAVKAAAPVGE